MEEGRFVDEFPIVCRIAWGGTVAADWGRFHSLALDSNGEVCGKQEPLVLKTGFSSNFRRVEGLPEITQIAAGYDSAAIDTEGRLWISSGRVELHKSTPKQISLEDLQSGLRKDLCRAYIFSGRCSFHRLGWFGILR